MARVIPIRPQSATDSETEAGRAPAQTTEASTSIDALASVSPGPQAGRGHAQPDAKSPASSAEQARTFIASAYERMKAAGGFEIRPGQEELSFAVAQSFLTSKPLMAEAPTGTGKTLAYLIGGLAAVEQLGVDRQTALVVATATVGLQSQVMTGDLPRLAAAGVLALGDAVLAKGRARYFCVDAAERFAAPKAASRQTDMFKAGELDHDAQLAQDAAELLAAWNDDGWDGDFDSYAGYPVSTTRHVAAMSETCTGNDCAHYNKCAFFASRRAMSSSKVVIANHDLVLSDLRMLREGADPLLPGSRYLCVFDEAHHLPAKAQDAGSAKIDFGRIAVALSGWPAYQSGWGRHPDLAPLLARKKLQTYDFDCSPLLAAMADLRQQVEDAVPEGEQNIVFEGPGLGPGIERPCTYALKQSEDLLEAFQAAQQALKGSDLAGRNAFLKACVGDLLYQGAMLISNLTQLKRQLRVVTGVDRAVRWAERSATGPVLAASPLAGSQVLQDLMWDTTRISPAMVSATLRDFGSFDHFKEQMGRLDEWAEVVLDPVLPYHRSTLGIVAMEHSPRQQSRDGFEQELAIELPSRIDGSEGTLVLFPSKALMARMLPVLRERFGAAVLAQGDVGIKQLVARHARRIEQGKGSVLCGLATLAEGLDLPGKLCTHVVICALPFAPPTSPVEQALQRELGSQYFPKRSMPMALIKLTQMVGRLVRRQSDIGRITVFDNRLFVARWGWKLLSALPRFKIKVLRDTSAASGVARDSIERVA